jgi:hypothetical protein
VVSSRLPLPGSRRCHCPHEPGPLADATHDSIAHVPTRGEVDGSAGEAGRPSRDQARAELSLRQARQRVRACSRSSAGQVLRRRATVRLRALPTIRAEVYAPRAGASRNPPAFFAPEAGMGASCASFLPMAQSGQVRCQKTVLARDMAHVANGGAGEVVRGCSDAGREPRTGRGAIRQPSDPTALVEMCDPLRAGRGRSLVGGMHRAGWVRRHRPARSRQAEVEPRSPRRPRMAASKAC